MESTQNHIVFIDESGDPGLKNIQDFNRYFTMAMIIFSSNEEVIKANLVIDELKQELNYTKEFHFCKTQDAIKDKFFNKIQQLNFNISVLIVDKLSIYSKDFKNNPSTFYGFILKQLITNSRFKLINPIIIIDGDKNYKYRQELNKYIKYNLTALKNLKFLDSKNNNLIQLADMITSCIQYTKKHKEKINWKPWVKIIRSKIKNENDIWYFV